MQSTKLSLNLGLILISFGLLTGCDSVTNNYYTAPASDTSVSTTPTEVAVNATPTPAPTATPVTATPTPDPTNGGTSTPTPVPSVAPVVATPTPTGNIYNLPDAPAYVSSINGAGGAVPSTTYSVQTSRTLVVKVTPLPAPNLTLAGYTNWNFPYGCMSVNVTVNGVTKASGILRVEGVAQVSGSICANSPTSAVLDFSNDVSGNGASSVTVSNADYDNCRYVNPLTYGCGMSAIFENHIVSSDITIQTDGTYLDTTTGSVNPSPTPDPSASPTPSPTPIGTPSPVIGG